MDCREIAGSIRTGWGEWSLADASRVLIRRALADPLNQRFIMVSESCAPLYPPGVVYQQLMYEKRSRINACDSDPNWYRDNYRCGRALGLVLFRVLGLNTAALAAACVHGQHLTGACITLGSTLVQRRQLLHTQCMHVWYGSAFTCGTAECMLGSVDGAR